MKMSGKGSAVLEVAIGAAIIVFVVFPVFSVILEKYSIANKVQIIKDAVDMTNISAYNALSPNDLGKSVVTFNSMEVMDIYRSLLARNLNLNSDLSPRSHSIAEGNVDIEALEIYTEGFPTVCPNGTGIRRPSVHSLITVPVKPSLYRQFVLNLLGREYIELKIHVDSDIPVNN